MSEGKRVVVDGLLQGMDRTAHCKVAGLRISPPDSVVFQLTNISIINAPKDLPDGIYELDFEGSGERVTKEGEIWKRV